MATWGSQTWGYYNWGTLGDVSVTLSGQSTLSLSVGSVDQQSNPGWGAQYWGAGEWGDLSSPEVALTGQQITTTVSAVTAITDVVVEVTGELLGPIIIGDYVDGISVETSLLGEELNSTVNSVFGGEVVTVQVTSASNEAWGENAWSIGGWGVGDGQTLSLGDTSIAIGQQINAQGQEITSTVNDVIAGILTGEELTTTSSVVSIESKYLIGSAEATTAVNSVTTQANADVIPTGVELAGSTGQLEYEATYSFNGSEATSTAGDVFGGEVVEVQVRTASAQPWGELAWGDGEWGQSVGTDIAIGADAVLTPSIDVPVTGEQLDWTIGIETVSGDANVTLSGVSAEIFQGDETTFTDVNIVPTGQQLSAQKGTVVAGISQLIIPTGVTATVTNGTIGINAWAVIEPNASTTWSVVDKAAA
jgi:hypothetical protein